MNFVLPSETPAIIEGEIASDSPAISDDGIAPEDETVPEDTVDSGELFRAYCMKCHVNRMFHGQVRELANGSRAAQGNCPVCNTKLTRIVKKSTPLTEDYDTPDDEPEVTAGVPQDEQPTEDAPVEGLIAEAVAEAVPEGTQMEEIAAAASNLAAEFSSAVDEGEKQKPINGVPRKRQGKKKTEPEPTSDEDLARVKAMEVTSCPNCHNNIPVKESGDGQLRYIMVHPDAARKLDRCPGSMAKVD
jgi:nitrate/TMAO reductase-like tetraheme cytochrome c subunit